MSSSPPPTSPLKTLLKTFSVLNSTNNDLMGCQKGMSLLGYTAKLVATFLDFYAVPTATTHSIVKGLSDLYGQTLASRYCIRLVNGPFSTFDAIKNDSWSYGPLPASGLEEEALGEYPYTRDSHPYVRSLEKVMPWTMAVYYPAEYVAYAGWFMPGLLHNGSSSPTPGEATPWIRNEKNWFSADHWSALSCIAWMCYVVSDIVVQAERVHRITAILKKLKENKEKGEGEGDGEGDGEGEGEGEGEDKGEDKEKEANDVVQELESNLHSTKLILLRECLFLLPAFAWSFPDFGTNPKISNNTINVLTWIENVVDYFGKCEARGLLGGAAK